MASNDHRTLSPRAREIVAIALELLEEEGPGGLSMRRLADVLDITAGSLSPTPGAVKKLRRVAPGFDVRAVERIYRGLCATCARAQSGA